MIEKINDIFLSLFSKDLHHEAGALLVFVFSWDLLTGRKVQHDHFVLLLSGVV